MQYATTELAIKNTTNPITMPKNAPLRNDPVFS